MTATAIETAALPAAALLPRVATPSVSVVLPSYNAQGCIMRAIDSLRAQTFAEWEAIVIDDASADGTAALVEGICREEPRLGLIRLARNGGPAHARNAGLAVARGTWIALLDADDAWRPDRLARLLEQAADADAVFDNLAGYDPLDRVETPALFPMFPAGALTIEALLSPRIAGSRYDFGYLKPIMRREFLHDHGIRYDESLRTSEDLLLYTTVLLVGARTRTVPAPLYLYTTPPERAGGAAFHSHTVPRDDEVGAALERLQQRFAGKLSAEALRAIEQRIAYLRRVGPLSRFYWARRTGNYRALAALLLGEPAVGRALVGEVWERVQRRRGRPRSVEPTSGQHHA
jgi:succinoglycan biosynthesis protein ExoO